MASLNCAGRVLSLESPQVMGILNVTPDSFSDGGQFLRTESAIRQAQAMVEAGASIIDIGGESTRPGADPVPVEEEMRRVLPVLEALHGAGLPAVLSVDTSKPEIMRAAVAAGAGLINDVYALRLPGALEAAASLQVPVCLMHMQGEPRSMQAQPRYADVVRDVHQFLEVRLQACEQAGLSRDRLLLDPGFGFGKTLEHNLSLLKHLEHFQSLGSAGILVGLSRKSMLGAILDLPVERRLHGSLAAAILAVLQGAAIVRAHDVGPTVEALRVVAAVQQAQ